MITDQKTTNSVNTIIMLLCSCRRMCTFAAKIAQNRFNEDEFRIYYGRIDWIESNNEYWLEQDARLRTDFNVTTGATTQPTTGLGGASR